LLNGSDTCERLGKVNASQSFAGGHCGLRWCAVALSTRLRRLELQISVSYLSANVFMLSGRPSLCPSQTLVNFPTVWMQRCNRIHYWLKRVSAVILRTRYVLIIPWRGGVEKREAFDQDPERADTLGSEFKIQMQGDAQCSTAYWVTQDKDDFTIR